MIGTYLVTVTLQLFFKLSYQPPLNRGIPIVHRQDMNERPTDYNTLAIVRQDMNERPTDYTTLAIVTCMFCIWPLSLAALILAHQVSLYVYA